MKNLFFYGAVGMMLLWSCQGREKATAEVTESFEAKYLTDIMKAPQSVSKEAIAEIARTDANKIKTYNEDFAIDVAKRTILFSWQNGEKKSVKTADGKILSINEYNSLGIGFVKKISRENFQKKFENKASVQDEINRITKDETVDADLAIMEARYIANNAKTQQFEKLENVGELAYWETPVNALHIFAKGICFTVTTNLANEKSSKETALQLAQLVFDNPLKSSK